MPETTQNKDLLFVKEVVKYFMDFLETDFHKRKFPKRNIKLRNSDNLLVGLNLQKYPSFSKQVFGLINHSFNKDNSIRIGKGVYKTNLPKNLVELIQLQVKKINQAKLDIIIEGISSGIEKEGTLHVKEYDLALTNCIETASSLIRSELVGPFVEHIEKPLQSLNLGDEDNIYLIEEELTSILLKLLENKISESLNLFIAKNKINLIKEIKSLFPVSEVKSSITEFFESLQVADLYAEVFEMDRNKNILDKQEFYLYFGDISFNNLRYPIFYIPFSVSRQEDILNIDFDAQIYINKKAIEFIVQEYNKQTEKRGSLKTISERIIYLAQFESNLPKFLDSVLRELIDFFELDKAVSFSDNISSMAKGPMVRVSNSLYINLFDKSDEALVNDYEDILQGLSQEDSSLAEMFKVLINDFIYKNPEPFNPEVESEWDNTETPDRLVFSSPIPLNSEQLQILSAIKKDGCKYVIVEGPPGTGKSHTITAIIFNAILNNQSVLVLSDKKEALDVVEDKITQTMNKVRFDKNFQNPILRLGKTGNTYGQILAKSAIEGIKTSLRAINRDRDALDQNIDKSINSLKEDLEAEVIAYGDVSIDEIHELFDLETSLQKNGFIFDEEEIIKDSHAGVALEEFRTILKDLGGKLSSDEATYLFSLLNIKTSNFGTFSDLQKFFNFLNRVNECASKVKTSFPNKIGSLNLFEKIGNDFVSKLELFIKSCDDLRFWPFGYLFNKKQIEVLDGAFKHDFVSSIGIPHNEVEKIKNACEVLNFVQTWSKEAGADTKSSQDKFLRATHSLLTDKKFADSFLNFLPLEEDLKYIIQLVGQYPETSKKLRLKIDSFETLFENKLLELGDLDFDKSLRYLGLKQKLGNDFNKIPQLNYSARKKNIEDLVTAKVTYHMDDRFINFYEHNKGDAEALRNIIRTKQRFPKDEFMKLKEAFPCILAGIRDYAEYIPLEPGIFDLVIIDEASQVSIAQAFPALLRAKKVLILGDKKQFSNIKSAQARSDTNREYLNNLEHSFRENVSDDVTKLVKLGKFNIKTSILEFFEFISNYNIQLLKHFRGYKEIISYSNKNFYQDILQVMKIRGKPIEEVIKLSFVEAEAGDELYPNTNVKEVEFIIAELQKLKDSESQSSVGIITPHTNQQKLLMEMISKLPERDYFFDKFNLKIMTFDTCQGEERDIIYYSMVASKHSDKLWGVFIKDLNSVDIEEDGQIKAQRLNVGFSRAKECMHLVLSKPLDGFSGSIGDALRHYSYVLEEAKKERSTAETDVNSKMEPEVMNWFYQTKFWQENKDRIEFLPQFEIGKYLKQLDRTYSHPAYRVDFLLLYKDERHKDHKIIMEYDGFKEHFKDRDDVNEFNYRDYYSDGDLYREKILESYGYKFLRINRFNIGENPISTLDERIARIIKTESMEDNPLLLNIHNTVESLQNGDMKECPKCKEVREWKDFVDSSLITGHGRFCSHCKNPYQYRPIVAKIPPVLTNIQCPRCNSKMILRDGRRGKFYGCSRFPYCKGTRNT